MKQVILVSIALTAVVFLLPFISMPQQPYIGPGQALTLPSPAYEATPASATASLSSPASPTPPPTPTPTPTFMSDGDVTLTVHIDGSDRELTLSAYLWGVLAGEEPPTFPAAALRTQAVAARTYVMYALEHPLTDGVHPDAVLCDNPAHCQAYVPREEAAASWGSMADAYASALEDALRDTNGQIMVYEGRPILAAYCSASSGKTERAADVWGVDVPYLQSVDSPGDEDAPRFQARCEVTSEEFWAALKTAHPDIGVSDTPFGTVERSEAGGVLSIEISGIAVRGVDVRQMFGLNSANFTVAQIGDNFVFDTLGFGHGVGLSQYGSRAMALEGSDYREILGRYYSGAQLAMYNPETKETFAVSE